MLVLSLLFAAAAVCAEDKPAVETRKSLGAKTLAQPCPVWVIGSYDAAGKPNVMTASWAAICCSQPPMVTVSLRKATYTYGSIMESKAFTVNIPSEEFVSAAAYFGSVSGRDVDKFAASGLTPVKSALVNAPYIKEFPLVLECKLVQDGRARAAYDVHRRDRRREGGRIHSRRERHARRREAQAVRLRSGQRRILSESALRSAPGKDPEKEPGK